MDRAYLLKYGMTGQVGRFAADAGYVYERGQVVVVRSWRGTELGEVLVEASHLRAEDGAARVLRAATADDLARGAAAAGARAGQFAACAAVFGDGTWPIDLIDVEPLLDEGRAVLHYLGPHRLDTAGLLAAFRARCGLDVMFQPAGLDETEDGAEPEEAPGDGGCGSCGDGGGCGTSKGGCTGCAVKGLIAGRR